MHQRVVLGDEAVHSGVSAAYAYPGTPSTEIVEFLIVDVNLRAFRSGREFARCAPR